MTRNEELLSMLRHTHDPDVCAHRVCVLHNTTKHHMSDWPMDWRGDRGILERTCEHGVGHYDPDQVPYWKETDQMWQTVHGCCGCCAPPEDAV